MKNNVGLGFTMAELLVALTILGSISAFSIPKILMAQQQQQQKAIFKETIGALSAIVYNGVVTSNITQATGVQYVMQNINAQKACTGTLAAGGCRSQAMAWALEQFDAGVVLHNGATVAVQLDQNYPSLFVDFLVDWNGDALPNTLGQYELYLIGVYAPGGGIDT